MFASVARRTAIFQSFRGDPMFMVPVSTVPGIGTPTCRQVLRFALCAAIHTSAAQAQPSLTLDAAVHLAQIRSRQLPAQEAMARGARDLATAARELPDPTLTVGITNLPIDGSGRFELTRDFMTMRSIGLMQELTRADKRAARSDRFVREAEAAEALGAAALADLQRDTASGWLDVHYAERLRDLMQAQRIDAVRQMEVADAGFGGGTGSLGDVIAARTAVAQIDDRIQQAIRDVASARTRLARWIGEDARHPLAAPPDTSRLRIVGAGLDEQVERYDPRVALMARQEAIARADAAIASSHRHADWTVEFMYGQRGPTFPDMVSLNLRIPLQWNQERRQDRELAAQLAKVEQMRFEREETVRERTAQTRERLERWERNRARLAGYDRSLVPLAADRTQAQIAAYRGGGGTLTAVLEARRMEIDVRIERLRLELETDTLWASIEFLIPHLRRNAAGEHPIITTEVSR